MSQPAAPSYGADQIGMICGYCFSAGGPGDALEAADVALWLSQREHAPPGEFLWLHFNLSHAGAEQWLREHLDLSEVYFESLHQGSHSTRIEYADGALIGVINDVLFDFAFDAADIATLWLSVDPRVVLTARIKPLRSIDRLRNVVRSGETMRSPVDLLVHLLRDQADVLVQIARDATVKVDRVEDDLLSKRLETKRSELGAMRRVLVRLRRVLAPEPSALFRLLHRPPAWANDDDVQDMSAATEEFSRVLSDIDSLVERIRLLQEEVAAEVNERTSGSLYVLTIVTVLALPINIIAGLFGMNVGGIPLAAHTHGFWIVIAVILSFTLVAATWALRKRG